MKLRNTIERDMTTGQIAKAQQAATEWAAAHPVQPK
jgi:hypothetical protein